MNAKVNLIKEMEEGFRVMADAMSQRQSMDEFPERTMSLQLYADYFKGLLEEKAAGRPVAWINYAGASEIFWAMDIFPVVIDGVTGMTAQTPAKAIPYIDKAEELLPDYLCSSNKIFAGAILSGHIPLPDMLVVPSHPCDSNLATYPVIAERFGFPYFCIDSPYFRDERGLRHVVRELGRLVQFLEDQTGQTMDYAKLKGVMEYSNRAHEILGRITKLAEGVPSPFSAIDMLTDYNLVLTLAGTPQLVDYLDKKLDSVKARVARHAGQSSAQKLRLVWIYGAPVFDFSFFFHLERKYGAFSVGNMNNNFVMKPVEDLSSIESVMRGLATKVINLPMGRECGGPWENYVDAMIDLCRRFKADAAIFAGHMACKANWPIMKLIRDRIADELAIPTLIFELDLMDPRVTSMDTIKGQFDDFFAVHFPHVVKAIL